MDIRVIGNLLFIVFMIALPFSVLYFVHEAVKKLPLSIKEDESLRQRIGVIVAGPASLLILVVVLVAEIAKRNGALSSTLDFALAAMGVVIGIALFTGIMIFFSAVSVVGYREEKSIEVAPSNDPNGYSALRQVAANYTTRLMPLEKDETFVLAVRQLRAEGNEGARAVAKLLDELLSYRCVEICDVLLAAGKMTPSLELGLALQRVIDAAPVISGSPRRSETFSSVVFGDGVFGWDDSTAARVKQLASDAKGLLERATLPPSHK